MNPTERKTLLKYLLDLSCAWTGMEKTIIFVRFDELPEEWQIEVIQVLTKETQALWTIFS